mgnify:CR=1 FL=1
MFGFSAFEVSGVSCIALGDSRVFAYEFVNMGIVIINRLSGLVNVYGGISLSLDWSLENLNTEL